ncbi:Glycosyltransferase involved in cell wall bisynthesis [Nocardioides psychrotolerans]|uniref:Glycosyltransferase involved in cell wall bisynthesis n=2 Tax=Nocardioides psychrotolerans TaxID=1005945 RepID=A0A1I3N620_9ACTN|nr:Glycosyltransferase involved in cell wall bisynthesis [Nocardioides psychrotolerans]
MTPGAGSGTPVVVVCFTGNSGLTDYSVSMCRELTPAHDVLLMTADSIEPFYRDLGVPVETAFRRSRHYLQDLLRFLRRVPRLNACSVVFQGPLKLSFLDALAVRYLRRRGVVVAVVVHDVVPHAGGRLATASLHFYYRSFPKLIVHSEDAESRLREVGVDGAVLVVPHGRYDIFDVDHLTRAEARAALGIDPAHRVALFFGNLEERKGLEFFVEAARESTDPALLFLAAGQDFVSAQSPQLRAVVRGDEVLPRLRVDLGRVPHRDVQKYFRAADVVVLPYLEGSTSGVLKLAIAFEVPVLATDVGDIRTELPPEGRLLTGTLSARSLLEGIADMQHQTTPQILDDRLAWRTIVPQMATFLLAE